MDTNVVTQSVLLIVAVIVASVAVVYVIKLWEAKQAQLTQTKWTLFTWIIGQAVIGTEQLWRAGLIQKDERLKNAVEIAQRELDAWGVRGINVKRITDACIAGVGSELNKAKLIAQSSTVPELPTGPQQ